MVSERPDSQYVGLEGNREFGIQQHNNDDRQVRRLRAGRSGCAHACVCVCLCKHLYYKAKEGKHNKDDRQVRPLRSGRAYRTHVST